MLNRTKNQRAGKKHSFFASMEKSAGFSLIEILIDLVIITLVSMAVLSAFMVSMKSMASARARIAAVSLANEKMELLRNMPYDSLATQHGLIYPAGALLDNEDIVRNGVTFTVNTVISYVDDPFDGLSTTNPKDIYPYDYKQAEITIFRKGRSVKYAKISSSIGAKAAETPSNTGLIKLCVVDSLSQPVPGAIITIQNTEVTPQVDIEATTPSEGTMMGCIMVPALPPDSHNHYHLTATKDGFSTDMTYPRTAQNPNALQPDVNVFVQQPTNQTLCIDALGTMQIHLVDSNGVPVANTTVHVQGEKEIYNNPSTKKYSMDHVTNANGMISLSSMEFDDYSFSVAGYTVTTVSPYQPTKLLAAQDLEVFVTVSNDSTSPVVSVCNPIEGQTNNVYSLTISGKNFQNNLVIKLLDGDGHEITGSNVVVTQHAGQEFITADFNLAGAITGKWDILITNPNNKTVRQIDGFEIKV